MYVLSVDGSRHYNETKNIFINLCSVPKAIVVVVSLFAFSFWATPKVACFVLFITKYCSCFLERQFEKLCKFFSLSYESHEEKRRARSLFKGFSCLILFFLICIVLLIKFVMFIRT